MHLQFSDFTSLYTPVSSELTGMTAMTSALLEEKMLVCKACIVCLFTSRFRNEPRCLKGLFRFVIILNSNLLNVKHHIYGLTFR